LKTLSKNHYKIKTFYTSSGASIFVGMDGESNDYLSLKLSKPNDLWFHVKGAPGSHVILSGSATKGTPGKADIIVAAELAAWFSKERNGGNVSVNYTDAKNVRKPSGVKAGSVQINKEKKIVVKPKLHLET
jgi:predicted ribosome quality control (RQC) complex YloA/Tae2 family protein